MVVLQAIPFPTIDPVAFEIGPVAVRWYGLAYMAALLLGWLYVKRLLATDRLWVGGKSPMVPDRADDLLFWATLGVVVGGRLGFVLFYQPGYYLSNPSQIPAVWNGGMSFHGGLIGVILVTVLFARRQNVSPLSLLDLAAAATPIGLFFGRLANFINGELYGRASDVAWAMKFPDGGDVLRHPSQLYEALTEGLILFLVLRFATHHRDALKKPGLIGGMFVMGYGVARIFCEFFREPDHELFVDLGFVTPGMFYSLPMVIIGGAAIVYALKTSNGREPIAG